MLKDVSTPAWKVKSGAGPERSSQNAKVALVFRPQLLVKPKASSTLG